MAAKKKLTRYAHLSADARRRMIEPALKKRAEVIRVRQVTQAILLLQSEGYRLEKAN